MKEVEMKIVNFNPETKEVYQGFDFVTYLKRHGFIGQIDPWRRHDNGDPVLCLLTSVEPALQECIGWSNLELTRGEFVKYLQSENIFVFRSIAEFEKYKGEKIEEKLELKKKRNISEDTRKKLKENMHAVRAKITDKELVIS